MWGRRIIVRGLVLLLVAGMSAEAAIVTKTYDLDQPDVSSPVQVLNGLSARAIFTFDTAYPTELKIELFNTSTGVPGGFGNEDQILTSISFDFGVPGYNGDPNITTGTVVIGPGGRSINFDNVNPQLGEGNDVSGEWGYGNMDGTGLLANFVTANKAQATRFPGDNLDGPVNIDGPQGGIVTDPPLIALNGSGAVADSVIIMLTIDTDLTNLDFLDDNGVFAEFGSDAAYLIPEPATILLLGIGGVLLCRRRHKT